jgi:hypothetical protein
MAARIRSSSRLLAVAALCCVTLGAPVAFGANATASTAHAKHCFMVDTAHGKTARVPTKCPKGHHKNTCYVSSHRHGKPYKREVSCPSKPPTKGATGATGATSSTGSPGGAGSGSGGGPPATVEWSTAVPAVCDDSSTPVTDGQGDFWCADQTSPYCTDQTAALLANPSGQVVCLPYTSIPAAGVCDDGASLGAGGTDGDGSALCADGSYPIMPADAQSGDYSNDDPGASCDDGSNAGDGGYDASGNGLCADGTYPS